MLRRVSLLLSTLVAVFAVAAVGAGTAAAGHKHGGGKSYGKSYGATTLKLDAGAVEALTGLGVTPSPIRPASAVSAGELAFPITNRFTSALRSGVIKHSGGIALTAGSTTVELRDFFIDPRRRVLTARVGDARVPILDLDFSKARISFRRGGLTIGPVGGNLTSVAAGALDSAFALEPGTVPAGLKLGDATVRYTRLW